MHAPRRARGTGRGPAASSGDRRPQHMRQRRPLGARRVGCPGAAGRAAAGRRAARCCGRIRHREDIGQRHLAGLVDEQDVDGAAARSRRPQPRRATHDVDLVRRASPPISASSSSVATDAVDLRPSGLPRVRRAMRTVDALVPRPHAMIHEVADDLVAVRGDADTLAGGHEGHDHPRPGERLSRARRSLDGERRVVERRGQSPSGLQLGLVRATRRDAPAACPTRGARRSRRSRAARYGAGAVDPVVDDPLAEATGAPLDGSSSGRCRAGRGRRGGAGSLAPRPLEVDGASPSSTSIDVRSASMPSPSRWRRRVVELASRPDVVVLRRESIRARPATTCVGRRRSGTDELERPEWPLVDAAPVASIVHPVEELPPRRLLLAPMPAQELRQQPPRLLRPGSAPPGRPGRRR